MTLVERTLNSCKSTVFFQKKKPKNFFLLILTIFRRIFRDRSQFTDQRRQNSHLLWRNRRLIGTGLCHYGNFVCFERFDNQIILPRGSCPLIIHDCHQVITPCVLFKSLGSNVNKYGGFSNSYLHNSR